MIDNQGDDALIGGFDPLDVMVTGLTQPVETPESAGDLFLGDLDYASLFLTYNGGDGNDLAIYSVVDSLLGDMDGDGSITEADISAFVLALNDPSGYAATYPGLNPTELGDINLNGILSNSDIGGFVTLLSDNGISSNVPEPTSLMLLTFTGLGLIRRPRRVSSY